jgi:DNA-binding HxlR family transcriptional regulator
MKPRHREETNGAICPLEELLKAIGGKWKVIILWHVARGPQRFGELRRRVSGVTQKMLTQQLRELEHDGFVTREVFAEVPPRVVYSATELTTQMRPLLLTMHDWAARHLVGSAVKP